MSTPTKSAAFVRPITPETPTRPRRERTTRMTTGQLRLRAIMEEGPQPEVVEVIAVCGCCEDRFEERKSLLEAFTRAMNEDSE